MQYWNSLYKDNQDERMYREETESIWHDIPGSKTEFRLSQPGMRMYIGATVLINKGKISGNVYEYKPMFQLRYYDAKNDNNSFSLFFNTANAQFLSTSFKILTEDSSIVSFFNKSDTSGWYVKQQYKQVKVMSTITLNKTSFLEIFPEVDERKLPAYRFRWCKDQQEIICVFTKGELITFHDRLNGFINMCPMYVNIFENELLKAKLNCYADQVASVQNTVFALNAKFDEMLKETKLNNEQIKNHFSTTLNSILAVMSLTNKKDIPSTITEQVINNVVYPKEEENDDDSFIIEKEDTTSILFETTKEDNVVDTNNFPVINKSPDDMLITAEEQPNGYFNTPIMYTNAQLEESMSADTMSNIFSFNKEEVKPEPIMDIESVNTFTEEEEQPEKWEIDYFAQRLHERFKLEFTDDIKERGKNVIPFDILYPKEVQKYITPETEEAVTTVSCVLNEEDMIKNINIDAILDKMASVVEPDKKYTIAHYLIDSGMFTKAYIAGMLINKGRIGIPVSSIIYATSVYATAYELIAKGEDPLKIANECGMHILNCLVESPKISANKVDIYNKYFTAIASDLTGQETTHFDEKLFALDKMLLREAYVFSAFDFKLDTLKENEKINVARALMDVYIMLYYAEKEHMLFNAQTSPNFQLYFIVNKLMYRFARSMLVNLTRCNKNLKSVKNAILYNAYDMKRFCQRIGWEEAKYRDALITFFTLNEISKKYVEPVVDNIPVGEMIPNTHIYRGIPCEEIMNAMSKIS